MTDFVTRDVGHHITRTTRLWETTIEVSFEADSAKEAEAIADRLTQEVFEDPCVWSIQREFDPEQTTETVDA